MFYKKVALKHFAIFTGKRLCWSLFFTKLQNFRHATLLKIDSNTEVVLLRNFCKTPILNNFCVRLLLNWLLEVIVFWIYNHFHNILRLFGVLPNFSFTTSETMRDHYLQTWFILVDSQVLERLSLSKLGNIRKVSKLYRMIT